MPTLGAPELIIILVIIILIFGVGKLPEVGQALGKGIREFRGAADGAEDEEEAPAAPARPAAPAPASVDAPRTAPAVEAPRQPVATAPTPAAAPAPVVAPAPALGRGLRRSGHRADLLHRRRGRHARYRRHQARRHGRGAAGRQRLEPARSGPLRGRQDPGPEQVVRRLTSARRTKPPATAGAFSCHLRWSAAVPAVFARLVASHDGGARHLTASVRRGVRCRALLSFVVRLPSVRRDAEGRTRSQRRVQRSLRRISASASTSRWQSARVLYPWTEIRTNR